MEQYYVDKAIELNELGYNCAQSVACSFAELLEIDENTLFKLTLGFGGGMAGNDGTCGAISGGVVVLSYTYSDDIPNKEAKEITYQAVKTLYDSFVNTNQSSVCKELKGTDTGVELRSCQGCIIDAVKFTYRLLKK